MLKKQDCCALNLTVGSLLADHSKSDQIVSKLLGCYVSPRVNKFVSPHPRASGDGYVVLGEWGSRGTTAGRLS